jgi:hypothetical protein
VPVKYTADAVLDGPPVLIGDGTPALRSLVISGYTPPVFLRLDGNPDKIYRIDEMPFRLTATVGSVEILSLGVVQAMLPSGWEARGLIQQTRALLSESLGLLQPTKATPFEGLVRVEPTKAASYEALRLATQTKVKTWESVIAPPPPPPPGGIPASVQRFDGGSGTVTVTNGVCFRPGDIPASAMVARGGGLGPNVPNLRVFVPTGDGNEKAVWVEVLNGRHADGSAKAVLIQFSHSVGGAAITSQIRLGEARLTTDISKQTLNAEPGTLIFPSDAAFLCAATPLWEPLVPMTLRPPGSFWDDWELRYSSNAAAGYSNIGSAAYFNAAVGDPANGIAVGSRVGNTYGHANGMYPWARHHYEFFCMTGQGVYLYRAIRPPFWLYTDWWQGQSQLSEQYLVNGLDMLMHYWMTGHTATRDAIRLKFNDGGGGGSSILWMTAAELANQVADPFGFRLAAGRVAFDNLGLMVICHHLGLPYTNTLTRLDDGLSGIDSWLKCARLVLGFHQTTANLLTGQGLLAWKTVVNPNQVRYQWGSDQYDGQFNFQTFIQLTALIMFYEWCTTDAGERATIQEEIRRAFNYIDTWWVSGQLRWRYADDTTNPDDGPGTVDLNSFGLGVIGWLYRKTAPGATRDLYRTRGDQAFQGMVQLGTWPPPYPAADQAKQNAELSFGTMAYIGDRQSS